VPECCFKEKKIDTSPPALEEGASSTRISVSSDSEKPEADQKKKGKGGDLFDKGGVL